MTENHTPRAGKPSRLPLSSFGTPPRRILLVNEDDDIRQLSMEVLSCCGYAVAGATDGPAALRALDTGRYDLLIANYKLSKTSGFELLDKSPVGHQALPVLMNSPGWSGLTFTRHPWLQPAARLAMPYTVAEFLETVENVLHMNGGAGKPVAPLPHPPGQLSANGLQPYCFQFTPAASV